MNVYIDKAIAASVKSTHPELYRMLEELIRRGEKPATIIRKVDRLVGGSLVAHSVAVTVRYLAAVRATKETTS